VWNYHFFSVNYILANFPGQYSPEKFGGEGAPDNSPPSLDNLRQEFFRRRLTTEGGHNFGRPKELVTDFLVSRFRLRLFGMVFKLLNMLQASF